VVIHTVNAIASSIARDCYGEGQGRQQAFREVAEKIDLMQKEFAEAKSLKRRGLRVGHYMMDGRRGETIRHLIVDTGLPLCERNIADPDKRLQIVEGMAPQCGSCIKRIGQ